MNKDFIKEGTVFVDAGLIWVGDPCYVMGDDASHKVTDWYDFCNELFSGNNEPLGRGVGMAIQSGYGDGEYPVYVRYSDGRPAEIRIVFIEDEND